MELVSTRMRSRIESELTRIEASEGVRFCMLVSLAVVLGVSPHQTQITTCEWSTHDPLIGI